MKKVLFLAILILNSQFLILNSLRAQGFEWVRTYTGAEIRNSDDPTNRIIGSCVDSAGNLYILGEFSPQAQLCGERLLPMDVITTPIKSAVVIAKLSPSGDLLWHKAIYNGKESCYAYALCMVGDSSVMIMATLYLPRTNLNRNLYYLDTLLTGNDDYLMPTDSVTSTNYTAFITFDLDGNAIERHLVCVGFKDSNGNDITDRFRMGGSSVYSDKLAARGLSYENFNVDSEGNIYVVRSVHMDNVIGALPCDTCERLTWSISDGTIGALKIVVDGTHNLFYPIPSRTALWNQQIMKFSPHFDSLLDAVYMFDSTLNRQCGSIKVNSFNIDAQNNPYITLSGSDVPNHICIANSNLLHLGDSFHTTTWMIKYDSNLFAENVAQLTFDGNGGDPIMAIKGTSVDDSTNTIFLYGGVSWTLQSQVNGILYRDNTLDLVDRSNFWLRLNMDDLSLLSVGIMHPTTGHSNRCMFGALATSNNRVFAQTLFNGAVFGDTTLQPSNFSLGFVAWDYSGHDIMVKTYGSQSNRNGFSQTHITDSTLYLTGYIYEDVAFDTIVTHNYGSSQAYIAKYVDPAFAQPYVHPSDRQEQMIEWQQDLVFTLADSPVTLTATATSGLPVSYTSSDSTIAYVEGDRLHLVADGHAWLTATQEGDYQYFPAEPVQRLLTVGNVGIATVGADGQAKAYPNPTSGRVTIDLAEIPPAPPLPYHRPRPSDTSDVDMVLYTSPGAPFPQYETCRFPYHQRYNMKVSGSALQSHDGVVTAWLTDMQGRREEVVLTPTGPDQYTLDLTSRPPAAYLLTVTTADGRELTFRLMKQYGRK